MAGSDLTREPIEDRRRIGERQENCQRCDPNGSCVESKSLYRPDEPLDTPSEEDRISHDREHQELLWLPHHSKERNVKISPSEERSGRSLVPEGKEVTDDANEKKRPRR